ncbi:MAG: HIT family protein [Polyangiaceae bacterium]|nr:HIT family protein [Myxococcales bacterium]MCB9586996.1 HIT family protein [Polyangiaceae bacterium]
MPERISRDAAVANIELPPGKCLACELIRGMGGAVSLWEQPDFVCLLPRLGVAFGQVLIVPRRHVVRFVELPSETWLAMSALAQRVACALERTLEPARCYVASLGTPRSDVPMSCAHLHIHVIPVLDPDARPAQVLTWSGGVIRAEEAELLDLRRRLRRALEA